MTTSSYQQLEVILSTLKTIENNILNPLKVHPLTLELATTYMISLLEEVLEREKWRGCDDATGKDE